MTLNTYLHFDGNCREAMTFYKECLGGELNLMTVGESPMADQMPAEAKKNILHGMLKSGTITLMASDMMGPGGVTKGTNISLTLNCSTNAEADAMYAKLSADGKAVHQMKQEFFGYYGDLTDKFGVNWLLSHENPQT